MNEEQETVPLGNEMHFAQSRDVAKEGLDRSFLYFREGNYDAAIEALNFLSTYMDYMIYMIKENKVHRNAIGFGEWLRIRNAGRKHKVQ